MYKVIDGNNEILVDNAKTLKEVKDKIITIFWYDIEDTKQIELKNLETILKEAELTLIKL